MSRARFDPSKAKGAEGPDLFGWRAGQESGKTISVSSLSRMIRRALEESLPAQVMVAGEISNLKLHSSGHVYFSLKDAQSQIPAVLWKSKAGKLRFKLADGLAVIATGHVEVYEPQGKYQLMVSKVAPECVGALELAFRQLKEKLAKEGLFDASAKKALPKFAWTIALVTSESGAAVRDMIRGLNRRFGALRILVYSVAVQGDKAVKEIAGALRDLDAQAKRLGGIDLIIMGRGGGSLEDLWAFNEEIVARAIYACGIPIISAVGHETDLTISDLVADVRAATPTAGAELAVPLLAEVVDRLLDGRRRLGRLISQTMELCRGRLQRVQAWRFFRQPLGELMNRGQKLDEVSARLGKAMTAKMGKAIKRKGQLEGRLLRSAPAARLARFQRSVRLATDKLRLSMYERLRQNERQVHGGRLLLVKHSPVQTVKLGQAELWSAGGRLGRGLEVISETQEKYLKAVAGRLRAVSPERVLSRGYSITSDAATGELIYDARKLSKGKEILTQLKKGRVRSTVKSTGT